MKNPFDVGQMIEARVVAVSEDSVFIDVQQKAEGIIVKQEFCDDEGNCSVKAGDVLKAYFVEDREGVLFFTTKFSSKTSDLSVLEAAYASGAPVEGKVVKEIKGGYEVLLGKQRAFCPYSQMGYRRRLENAEYVGQNLTFRIQEYGNNGRDIVLSNKVLLEEEEKGNLLSFFSRIKEGSVVEGTVVSLVPYGAFVDLGGFRALLPLSEISYARVKNLADVLKEGQKIKVKVLQIDTARSRVSLSMKALEKDPWDTASAKFPAGTKLTGRISRVADFGVFVELEPGVEGLVHISRLNVGRNTNIRKVYRAGDPFAVVVDKIDTAARRISLSPVVSKEEADSAEEYIASHKDDDSGEAYNPFAALLKKN